MEHPDLSGNSQDCARFTRKTYAQKAQIVQTHSDEIGQSSNKDDF